MPNKGNISVNDYLFGNKSKTDVKSVAKKKIKTTFQNVPDKQKDIKVIKKIKRSTEGKKL